MMAVPFALTAAMVYAAWGRIKLIAPKIAEELKIYVPERFRAVPQKLKKPSARKPVARFIAAMAGVPARARKKLAPKLAGRRDIQTVLARLGG